MSRDSKLPPKNTLKAQAKRLRAALVDAGEPVRYARALELVAQQYGFRDWNTLYAALGNRPEEKHFSLGDSISGRYLKQKFAGQVVGLERLSAGRRRITIQFDDAVDVVEFDSFSAFRQRVTAVIDDTGRAYDKTSDDIPHLILD